MFEISNLVRTVLCIDRAHGNLRARLTALLESGQLSTTPGGYYVRWELTEAEAEALQARLDAYQTAREGRLPGSAGEPPRPVKLAKRRAA